MWIYTASWPWRTGVVRAQGRKIIFTTNLPNIGDIDEALVRPGRCFATVRTRALERREAASLLARISAARDERIEPENAVALVADIRSITLASLYRLVDAEAAWHESQRPDLGVDFIAEIERCLDAVCGP